MIIDLRIIIQREFLKLNSLGEIFVLGKAFEDEWGSLVTLNDRNEDENNET